MKVRILAMLATSAAGQAAAQALPTTFDIEEHPIQKVPSTFKFQAKVSQGKIPTGDATFEKVYVNVKRGTGETLCTETLNRVKVRDSVLNLEVGRGMSCQLDEVVANNADLSFQICVNNTDSCLKPIALSTVPFAVKSTFAAQAQEAHKSDVAGQANYAHRASADADLFITNHIGYGYYDFTTPASASGRVVSGEAQEGGFFAWAGVGAANKLNICAKDDGTGGLQRLNDVAIHSNVTRALGELRVTSDAKVGANVDVGASLAVVRDARIGGSADITQAARLGSTLDVTGDTRLGGNLDATRAAHVGSTLEVGGNTSVGGALAVQGNSSFASGTFTGDVVFRGSVTLPSGNIVAGDSVNSAAVVDDSLRSVDIADGTLQSIDIADGTLQSIDIADGAVGTADLANSSVNGAKIASGVVTTAHLADGSLTEPKFAAGVLSTRALADGSVTETKLGAGAVSTRALADGSVTSAKLAANSVSSGNIADGQVTSADVADYTIGASDINGGVVNGWHIQDNQVTSADIADYTIGGADINGGVINNWHIQDGQVTSADITNKTITSDDVQFAPRRVAYTATDWSSYYPGITTAQYSVCALVAMGNLDASATCNMLLNGNQWYVWARQATCSFYCF